MAKLIKRRDTWYGRVRWRDDGAYREKQIPLRTKSKVTALERLKKIKEVEYDIKSGIGFSFAWLNDSTFTIVKRFTLNEAVSQWMGYRKKNKIRVKTLELNQLGLDYFMECNGFTIPLQTINNSHILTYVDYLDARGNSDTTINIHLRTIKAMLRHFYKIGKLDRIPVIEQRKIAKTDPIYISESEFKSLKELGWLDDFYKKVFLFYRETGMRLREPIISSLNGDWIDIPPESKSHSVRSIELSAPFRQIFIELKDWLENGYGSKLSDSGDHLSKLFKKALREIGADESKHFHSLRHTFAVRSLLMGTSIYEVKLLMGHASVTTTEQYSNMNLKRVAQDFPSMMKTTHISPKSVKWDTIMWDTPSNELVFHENRVLN